MSIDGPYDDNNVFAKILRGELPAWKLHEDAATLALLDVFPQAPGHSLVIPKAPARNLLDLDPSHGPAFFDTVRRTAAAVRAAMKPDGLIVTQFNGAPAGQTVFHLHFHIIPRWDDQPMGRHVGGMIDKAEADDLAARIRAAYV
jgi:histidine triad (HIT) family protein